MDKTAIKKYAIWARTELIERVTQRAWSYDVKDNTPEAGLSAIGGRVLTPAERHQRDVLVETVQAHGFRPVMEAAAYTWFNRLAALRFMEVNGYLPTRVRVFTDAEGTFHPEILTRCIDMQEPWIDREKVFALQEASETDALYRYLLIGQCNALGEVLPALFEPLEDWTELLLPDNLLREGSVLARLVADIPEDDWRDAVQIIGWLYQYYNTEPKAAVFASNEKVQKEDIPAATQLFTPDWIVRYMVENSLGRYWLERHPECTAEDFGWRYYLPEAEQTPEVAAELARIRAASQGVRPEDIRLIDPCMGSGHILVYAFDVLYQIYQKAGYPRRQIASLILEHNLYGLDIDTRAYQLAYFAVMMKARQYDRNILQRHITPHLAAIVESNGIDKWELDAEPTLDTLVVVEVNTLLETFRDAQEYGSLLTVEAPAPDLLDRWEQFKNQADLNIMLAPWVSQVDAILPRLVQQAEILAGKYEVVVTNPPYMGGGRMEKTLTNFAKKNYPNSKSDLSTISMEKFLTMLKDDGFLAMINIPTWMFIGSYKTFRLQLLTQTTFINMIHPGRGAFGSDFGTVAFIIAQTHFSRYMGTYHRLFDRQGDVERNEIREKQFLQHKGRHRACQDEFLKLPAYPFAYWISQRMMEIFINNPNISLLADVKDGFTTGNNDVFLRLWFECSQINMELHAKGQEELQISTAKWYPYNKGGSYRKWYGNNIHVINWEHNGDALKKEKKSVLRNKQYIFKKGITWTLLSSSCFGVRILDSNSLFDTNGKSMFPEKENRYYIYNGPLVKTTDLNFKSVKQCG